MALTQRRHGVVLVLGVRVVLLACAPLVTNMRADFLAQAAIALANAAMLAYSVPVVDVRVDAVPVLPAILLVCHTVHAALSSECGTG